MLNIKVLGAGCEACNLVEQQAVAALEELVGENPSLEATVQHVQDYGEIMKYSVMFTPALVVNEKVVCAGRIPTVDEIMGWLREALEGRA